MRKFRYCEKPCVFGAVSKKKVVLVQQDSMVMFIVLRCVVDKCDWSASRDFFFFSIYLSSSLSQQWLLFLVVRTTQNIGFGLMLLLRVQVSVKCLCHYKINQACKKSRFKITACVYTVHTLPVISYFFTILVHYVTLQALHRYFYRFFATALAEQPSVLHYFSRRSIT